MTSAPGAWTRLSSSVSALVQRSILHAGTLPAATVLLIGTALPAHAQGNQEPSSSEPGQIAEVVTTSSSRKTSPLLTPARSTQSIKPGKAYFRVLSYNVKGLPSLINSYKKSRFPVIGSILRERLKDGTAPDVVLIQEAFIDPSRAIMDYAGYPHVANGPGKRAVDHKGRKYKRILNSGIFMMSKLPIQKQSTMTFPKTSCATWDCLANKGAQFITVRPKGVPFDISIINTHAQAEMPFDHVRKNQFAWLNYYARTSVNFSDPYHAMIFAGDFNSKPSWGSYDYVKNLVGVKNVGEECADEKSKCEIHVSTDPKWLCESSMDQIFYSSGKRVRIRPVEVERNFAVKHRGKFLSDHLGYETLFEISWN